MTCPRCGAENRLGREFWADCGTPLALSCPTCGAPNEPHEKFCGEYGTALTAASPAPTVGTRDAEGPLVTVLFADPVAFTSLSEHRDPEDVRKLLSTYFEQCRVSIERHGGTVKKFLLEQARRDENPDVLAEALQTYQGLGAVSWLRTSERTKEPVSSHAARNLAPS